MRGTRLLTPELTLTRLCLRSPTHVGLRRYVLCCLLLMLSVSAQAESPDNTFERQVLPILQQHCLDCHSGELTELGLDLASQSGLFRGSETGHVLVPGKASQSLILQLVAPESKPHMPPDGQLSDAEIATLTTWIDGLQNVTLPPREIVDRGRGHWAFQRMAAVQIPEVRNPAWLRNPIDAFILGRLETEQLRPAGEATPAELVRRVYFDVTGLPPAPEDVEAFLQDTAPAAYERLVDRLLSSPAYGERWGRHWLDLARYADSSGFHDDIDRPDAWRYRDYVIQSLNDDKSYRDFVREQLAGDEIAPDQAEILAATGFCRNGPTNDDNMGNNALERERYRLDILDDTIATTSAVFMGLTVGCARCHDHKFDPIPQTDYYRLLAVFNSTTRVTVPIDGAGQPLLGKKREKDQPGIMALTEAGRQPRTTHLLWRGDAANPGPEVQPGTPVVLASLTPDPFDASRSVTMAGGERTTGRRRQFADWLTQDDHPLTWRVAVNRIWQQHFGTGLVATPSNFGLTGSPPTHPELLDWLAGELVKNGGHWKPIHRLILTSATYRQSSKHYPDGDRLDPDNRWLWRMPKKRLEAEAIRDAVLVAAGTLNATQGGPGVKPKIPAELLVASQRNKWPVVKDENGTHWRRSVYVYVKRQLLMPMLELFDAPSTNQTCEQRALSIVPTQALVLMNDDFMQEQAGYLADRVLRESGDSPASQIERAHRITLGRPATSVRVAESQVFLQNQTEFHQQQGRGQQTAQRQALIDLCHVLLNCNEFVYVD